MSAIRALLADNAHCAVREEMRRLPPLTCEPFIRNVGGRQQLNDSHLIACGETMVLAHPPVP